MKRRFHLTLPLICFLTPVLLWLLLLIVLPHVELLRMSLRTEDFGGDPAWVNALEYDIPNGCFCSFLR